MRKLLLLLPVTLTLALLLACQGPEGEQGPAGARGPAGATPSEAQLLALVNQALTDRIEETRGPAGLAGARGPQGDDGADGAVGPQGPQGEQGAKGDTGEQGSIGPPGQSGSQGPRGERGAQGPPGVNGEDGNFTILAPPANLTGTNYDLAVSRGSWVGVINQPVTLDNPAKVLVLANATIDILCPALDLECNHRFKLALNTELAEPDGSRSREFLLNGIQSSRRIPASIGTVFTLPAGAHTIYLLGHNDRQTGPQLRNATLTVLIVED